MPRLSSPDTETARLQSDVLHELTAAPRYRRWLADMATPHLGDAVLEVGAGIGDYTTEWLSSSPTRRITASEADGERLELLRARFDGHPRVKVRHLALPSQDEDLADFSSTVAINVLEHVVDDFAAVRSMARLTRRSGAVIVLVPAFQGAFSDFDRRIGHYRRYRCDDVRRLLANANLEVETLHYVNSLGLLAWFVGMRLLRMTPGDGPVLRAWDASIVSTVRRLETRRRPPFGQSVFAVGRKTSP